MYTWKRGRTSIIQQPIVLDGLPSTDEWIIRTKESILRVDYAWVNSLDKVVRNHKWHKVEMKVIMDNLMKFKVYFFFQFGNCL